MFILNTEAVIVGFLKEALQREGFDLETNIPLSQHKQHVKKLT